MLPYFSTDRPELPVRMDNFLYEIYGSEERLNNTEIIKGSKRNFSDVYEKSKYAENLWVCNKKISGIIAITNCLILVLS